MFLIFDTETSGLVNHKKDFEHESQPHIVQLAAMLLSPQLEEISTLCCIIRPEGWTMPPSILSDTLSLEDARAQKLQIPACDIHGITQEIAEERGIPLGDALALFDAMAERATTAVCHNTGFDFVAVEAEFHRLGWTHNLPEKRICTMRSTTQLCELPGKFGFKWPQLQELHQFLFGEGFDGAHDALNDVRATARCFRELQARKFDNWER